MKQNRLLVFDFIFFITILLLVSASFFSYNYINSLNESYDRIDHTNTVKLELEKALSYVKDGEAAQRGFLLSRDSSFLEPMKASETNTIHSIRNIESLTSDNPAQQERIKQLKELVNNRFSRLNYLISNPPPGILHKDTSLLGGKRIMDKLREEVNTMVEAEDILLLEREKEKNKFVLLTPLYSLLFSVLAIFIVVFVYSRLRKENKLRTKAESAEAIIHNFFQQVPAMLAIMKGKEHRFVFANEPYIGLIGKKDIVGKTIVEALPEIKDQEFVALMDKVYTTGDPHIGKETLVTLNRDGTAEQVYINFIYQAYVDHAGKIEGIMVFCYDVSEMFINRKKVEELEERSRLAIEASEMGVFDWDLQHHRFISSPRLLEIFGFNGQQEVKHTDLINRIHPDDKAMRDKAVADSYKAGSMEYEARIIWPDKSIHWINVYGKVIYDDKKEALRMYGSVIDITAKKSSLEEIKESESKFRVLAESLTQQVWTTDAEGRPNYFNPAIYEFSGVTEDDINKIGWMNTIHPDEKEENIEKWAHALATGEEFISEHRLRDKHGDYSWHITMAVPQFDEKGVIKMWVGTSTDIQDQKLFAEELEKKVIERTERLFESTIKLKLSEDRYYSMISEVQDYAILLLDAEGNIQNWNKGAEKIKGYRADEIIGKSFKLFYLQEDREAKLPDRLINEARQIGKAENQGWRLRKDGSRFWANVVITALHDDKKNVIGFSKVTRDLTDRKNAEERQLEYLQSIEQKNLELERSNAELESFNYIASHDLQEPLRKIQAFSQLILEKERNNLSASGNDYFSRIHKAASGMQNLIEALISYSQTNSATVQLAETDLNKVLEEVKNDLSNILEEKNAVIESDVLPLVQADPIQFRQLFTNLVTNAVKYSKPGIPPVIKFSSALVRGKDIGEPDAVPERGYWKICIEDNGIGFDEKYKNKIFELFQRLHGKLEYQGTGIGLAICKKIMRNHEGFISATGTLNKGAIFTIFLPLKNKFI